MRLPRVWRRLLTWALVPLVWLVLLEGLSWVVFRLAFHESFDFAKTAQLKQQRIAAAAAIEARTPGADALPAVPHPYMGFVYNPRFDPAGTLALHSVPVSEWGFLDDKPPLRRNADGEVVVGIFGGSVAFWLSVRGIDAMIDELSALPRFRGKRFVIVRTALGAFKQPQQLMTLTYLLAQGGHFDIVVNLDGFNEVALPPVAQIPREIFPFFPRGWPELLGQAGDPQSLRLTGRVLHLAQLAGERAEQLSGPWLDRSVFASTLWRFLDGRLALELAKARYALETYTPPSPAARRTFSGYGPLRRYGDSDEMYRDLAAVWRQSSLQMHQLCRANGILYVHFLQPNQYLTDSKPMSPAERRVALQDGRSFERDVPAGYPLLVAAGRTLAEQGVAFEDLSRLFAGISEPLYIDNCCHFNQTGNDILGRAMGRSIAAIIAKSQHQQQATGKPNT